MKCDRIRNKYTHTHYLSHLSYWVVGGAVAYPRGCWLERQEIPWTGHQSITGQIYRHIHSHTFTTRDNLASPIRLT